MEAHLPRGYWCPARQGHSGLGCGVPSAKHQPGRRNAHCPAAGTDLVHMRAAYGSPDGHCNCPARAHLRCIPAAPTPTRTAPRVGTGMRESLKNHKSHPQEVAEDRETGPTSPTAVTVTRPAPCDHYRRNDIYVEPLLCTPGFSSLFSRLDSKQGRGGLNSVIGDTSNPASSQHFVMYPPRCVA